MKRALAILVALRLTSLALAQAQAPPPCAVWSNAENRCLQLAPTPEALAACGLWSTAENRCLDPLPPAAPVVVSAAEHNDPNRQAALTALHAVESVLAGGANASEFKKYYLEARVKVDALPASPGNASIKEVSGIYADAITLSIAEQVHDIGADEVRRLKQTYGDSSDRLAWRNTFSNIPDAGISRLSTKLQQDLAVTWLHASGQLLLILAKEKLAGVK